MSGYFSGASDYAARSLTPARTLRRHTDRPLSIRIERLRGDVELAGPGDRAELMEEAAGDALGARAGTSALVWFGGAFGYRELRSLVVRGIPAGPGPVPEGELPDEELEAFDEPDEDLDDPAPTLEEEHLGDFDIHQKYRAAPKAADTLHVVFALPLAGMAARRRARAGPRSRRRSGDRSVGLRLVLDRNPRACGRASDLG